MGKDAAAVELGRKGGEARAENLSDEELSAAGRKAITARWKKYYREHPEKLEAKKARLRKKRRKGGSQGRAAA